MAASYQPSVTCELESLEKIHDLSQKYNLNTKIDASNFKSVPEEMVGVSVEGGMFLHGSYQDNIGIFDYLAQWVNGKIVGSNPYGIDIIEDVVRFFGGIYGITKGDSIDSGLLVKPTKN